MLEGRLLERIISAMKEFVGGSSARRAAIAALGNST
jgi:hypothetical protein